jgi:hypothetical protein
MTQVRTTRPSPAHSSQAPSDTDGPGDVQFDLPAAGLPEVRTRRNKAKKRPILHLKTLP